MVLCQVVESGTVTFATALFLLVSIRSDFQHQVYNQNCTVTSNKLLGVAL